MTEHAVLTAAEVARLLRYRTAARFYDRRRELEAAGFPRPLPGLGRLRYSRVAVEAWLRNPAATPVAPLTLSAEAQAEVSDVLARRAAAIAAG